MFIGTVWYRQKNQPANPFVSNATYRDADRIKVIQQAEAQARILRPTYETQVLVAEVTHEVVPPELDFKLVPFKG